MPLTPEDVSNKRFTPVRLREGYDMGEVDQFLDEVESELARLTSENDELRGKLGTAQGGTPPAKSADKAPAAEEKPAKAAAATTGAPAEKPVAAPQETLEVKTAAEASSAAVRLLEIATRNADELVGEARTEAERIVGEATTEAERREAESKERSDKLETDARTRSQALDEETSERRTQLFGDLDQEKAKLNTEVENLRSFEREYRSRLKSYFSTQLAALDGATDGAPGPVAPSDQHGDQPQQAQQHQG